MATHIRRSLGFTLIELMIVVAVISLLAIVAAPKFSTMLRKSQEASTLGRLGTLRSALSIYHADTDGRYPNDRLECLLVQQRYLSQLPMCDIPPYHPKTAAVSNADDFGGAGFWTADPGTWLYLNDDSLATAGPRAEGDVWVGCSHLDSKNRQWTSH